MHIVTAWLPQPTFWPLMAEFLSIPFFQDSTAQYLAASGVTVVMWDYCITLGAEIRYFWKGGTKWSPSRIMFFMNRYLALTIVLTEIYVLKTRSISPPVWEAMILLTGFMLIIIQAMHTLRLWYLISSSAAFNTAPSPAWIDLLIATVVQQRVWLPIAIIHAILYLISAARTFRQWSSWGEEKAVRERILLEGAGFSVVLFGSIIVNAVGGFGSNLTMLRGVYSNLRSFSTSLGTDPEWLLSHLELSRVNWTRGAHTGELIVDIGEVRMEDEHELQSPTGPVMSQYAAHSPTC
ncbi:hypothetical protein NEOLEDRAFT_44287 [Neolentinus lepideus HHB14362 ss-1]|uniref:DUF6533 domain-containing protein n=1 Tax=Neolentinus lepideus HHB14362 ss-1 TaxID=1314782 RepID=A0A165WAB0_9AGAM|nr:hypothetical protein NEOLEDRAFT_44287 [Neolentinus lepideus HHB14362 ss-1]